MNIREDQTQDKNNGDSVFKRKRLSNVDDSALSMNTWLTASPPNYDRNINKYYPYSETPTLSTYNHIKIPPSLNDLLEHVDYWGEGRIISDSPKQISGFVDCYNINHQYKLVSKGSDANRKIPNRIPVDDYVNCNTSNLIKDNSVKLVTVIQTEINTNCAKDIARIVNNDFGKVIIFGYDEDTEAVRNIEAELYEKGLVYYKDFELPDIFEELTFKNFRAYLSVNNLIDHLYANIENAKYAKAVNISKALCACKSLDQSITYIVKKLMRERNKNIMNYAYQLWINDEKDFVIKYFPEAFTHIFKQDCVRLFSPIFNVNAKLDNELSNTPVAIGDNKSTSDDLFWIFNAIWDKNSVWFKLMNVKYTLFLSLDVEKNFIERRKARGTIDSNDESLLWSLEPMIVQNKLYFQILNHRFGQKLMLDFDMHENNTRILWGQDVHYDHDYFKWFILPCIV